MFCSKCGAQNPEDAVFCENCGNPIAGPSAFTLNAAAPYAPAPAAPVKKRWPVVFPILFGLALLMEIYFLIYIFSFGARYGIRLLPFTVISSVLSFLIGVLILLSFILPTRDKPFLTAIPRILSLLLSAASIVVAAAGRYLNSSSVPLVGMGMIAIVFYIIDTAARPHGKALAIIHAVFAGAVVAGSLVNGVGRSISLYSVVNALQTILLNVGYILALFMMARRPKKA